MSTPTGIAARRIAEAVRDLIREEVPVEEEKFASDEMVTKLAVEIKKGFDSILRQLKGK